MDYADLGRGQKHKGVADLLCKLAYEVKGDAFEGGVAYEVVKIVGEVFKH